MSHKRKEDRPKSGSSPFSKRVPLQNLTNTNQHTTTQGAFSSNSHKSQDIPRPRTEPDGTTELSRARKPFPMVRSTDPYMCPEYLDSIMYNLHHKERGFANYFTETQNDINDQMVGILIDWLIELIQGYGLSHETIFLTRSIIDYTMEAVRINREELQLLGTASLLIASKFEDPTVPSVQDLAHMSDYTYSTEEIRVMEQLILRTIDFGLTLPTQIPFLNFFLHLISEVHLDMSRDVLGAIKNHSMFYSEVSLHFHEMAMKKPSLVALSSVCMSLAVEGFSIPSILFESNTRITRNEVSECITALHGCVTQYAENTQLKVTRERHRKSFGTLPSLPIVLPS